MLKTVTLCLAVAACGNGIDDGTPLTGCPDCAPGTIRHGRMFLRGTAAAANAAGDVAIGVGHRIGWLDGDFAVRQDIGIPVSNSNMVITLVAIDDDQSVAAVVALPGESASAVYSLAFFDRDGELAWQVELGAIPLGPFANFEVLFAGSEGPR